MEREKLERERGWSPVPWSYEERENVVGVYLPEEGEKEGEKREKKGKSLIVNGHLDVVPIEEEASEVWTNDPFKAVVREGRLYGREKERERERWIRQRLRASVEW